MTGENHISGPQWLTHSNAKAKDGVSPASKTRFLLLKLRWDPATLHTSLATGRNAVFLKLANPLSWPAVLADATLNGACELELPNGLASLPRPLLTLIACLIVLEFPAKINDVHYPA